MSPLPDRTPKKLSLGRLEAEILGIIWDLGSATAKDIHDRILSDPDRELAYASVSTVLNRLANKGWLSMSKKGRAILWHPLVSRQEARSLQAYEHLNNFLQVGNADIVAAFADQLDRASLDKIDAIAQRLQQARQDREAE
ncbi:transcriptional repressor, CopY family [Thalassoporum mexicanum PCC 7367]|uniref:BlaI/MecI/CopY family transcriptional regulator n=1 Tax=Thalassoporum mexicanum TaxID=3457544 RepID=UPI00029F8301|nr:BlaI/MecI/CopY family transcriptional regulator [Pseudanabaena sp. PCC 7367]AFY70960.1 transcriptional repressor, CopY family [Pseudanabaena sp. PCC 7367]